MMATLSISLTACTFGLCAVLVLRRGMRRMFGSTITYGLWSLPVAAGIAPWLPTMRFAPAASLPMTHTLNVIVQHASASMQTQAWLHPALTTVWSVGAALFLFTAIRRHVHVHRDMRPLTKDMRAALSRLPSSMSIDNMHLHAAGPAVIRGLRTLLLLPDDFMTRFDETERRLVLEHEYTHLRHGDAWWNLLAELFLCLLWFHPLAHFARSRFRLDQELACDEALLRRLPGSRGTYARTLFHGTGHAGSAVLANWLDEPQLKERLTMIRNLAPPKRWRRTGVPVITALLAASVFSAQAMIPLNDQVPKSPANMPTAVFKEAPVYPAKARKDHVEGMVVLRIKVGTKGRVLSARAESTKAAPMLVQSALEAARQWRFRPATNSMGKPVVAWIKVPVAFRLGKDKQAGK
jgi:TonB family protein